uniref:Zinc finger and SCAN domain containing 5B n=1 Tax=Felis catus TaxID=9685 RepID=A0ABI8AGL5_FELCA
MAADQTFSREKAQGALAGTQDSSCEQWHMSFRAFSGSGQSDPVEDLRRLYELCYLWLRPDLHTKEQILDMLVMEQFMISMPQELQVLVKESAVQSCKDLQDVLRSSQRPKKWTIVSIEGQEFLMRSSDVQMANAEAGDRDLVTDLSKKPQSSGCEIHPENIQVNRELQNLPGTSEPSKRQGQNALLPETIPGKGVLEGLRPKENLEKNLTEDLEETKILKSQEPPFLKGPAPMKTLQEGTRIKNVDAEKPSTQVSERQVSTQNGKRRDSRKTQRSSKRRKQENTSISQDMATHLDKGEFSGQPVSSVHPVGKKTTGGTSNVCSLCKKEFRYKSQFSIHWRTHTGERPFKCNTCSGSFMQTSDLRVHQRIHTGEKPYCCEICLKTFTHDSTLRSHKRIHTKEKPYVCEECGKAFSHKGNLNVHQRTHSGVKPYTCHECNCAFRQLGTFKRHQKIHKMTSQ